MEKSRSILHQVWGYPQFRPMQEDIVDSAVYGHDILALLPTGGGKSICFQVPGLCREGVTLVISPLIALMNDQVQQLQRRGVRAQAIHSNLSKREIDILLDNAVYGGLDFLYLSPERLQTSLFKARLEKMQLSLVVVDEAHCISEWGHDFRPPYLQIHELREIHPEVPFMAVTATATKKVQEDIVQYLKLRNHKHFEASFVRPNLRYHVSQVDNKKAAIVREVKSRLSETGIVYCRTRKNVKEITRVLLNEGCAVGLYHAGLSAENRQQMMQDWIDDKIKVMVATNAFGMGINKPNVRYVLHYEMPDNLEGYFQEAGRGGRDEKDAQAIVYWNHTDIAQLEQLFDIQYPEVDQLHKLFRILCYQTEVAIGSGCDETYPVDLVAMAKRFDIPVHYMYHGMKALEKAGHLIFNEAVFQRTKVRIAISNDEIYSLQVSQEKLAPLLKILVRSYPGIFQLYFEIHEKEICERLKLSKDQLTQQLQQLEKLGVVEVQWQHQMPTVTFLDNRPPDDQLPFSKNLYKGRKQKGLDRLKAVKRFLTEPICRGQQLLHYFDQEGPRCGRCDICEQMSAITSKEQVRIQLIKELHQPRSLEELHAAIPSETKLIDEILQELLLNELVIHEAHVFRKK